MNIVIIIRYTTCLERGEENKGHGDRGSDKGKKGGRKGGSGGRK